MATKRRISNRAIVILKTISALALLFALCLYLFINFHTFVSDLGFNSQLRLGTAANPWYNLGFALALIFGFCFIIYYIGNMVIRFETKQLWKADRMFVFYQIVFTGLLVITIWRWFFINLSAALVPSVIMIIAGILNLLTPRIIDNNNVDF